MQKQWPQIWNGLKRLMNTGVNLGVWYWDHFIKVLQTFQKDNEQNLSHKHYTSISETINELSGYLEDVGVYGNDAYAKKDH